MIVDSRLTGKIVGLIQEYGTSAVGSVCVGQITFFAQAAWVKLSVLAYRAVGCWQPCEGYEAAGVSLKGRKYKKGSNVNKLDLYIYIYIYI